MHLQGVFWTIVMSAVLLPVTLQDPDSLQSHHQWGDAGSVSLQHDEFSGDYCTLVVVFGMVALRESIIRFFERQAAERKRRKENENMFYEVSRRIFWTWRPS